MSDAGAGDLGTLDFLRSNDQVIPSFHLLEQVEGFKDSTQLLHTLILLHFHLFLVPTITIHGQFQPPDSAGNSAFYLSLQCIWIH